MLITSLISGDFESPVIFASRYSKLTGFTETQVLRRVAGSGGSFASTIDDCNFIETDGTQYTDYTLSPQFDGQTLDCTFSSNNTSVATIVERYLTAVSSGDCVVTCETRDGQISSKTISVSVTPFISNLVFSSFVSGSLANNMRSSALALAATSSTKSYVTANGSSFSRDSACWAASVDFGCFSVWNSTGQSTRAGTLITPRHIIFATHFQIEEGATVKFLKSNGEIVSRTILKNKNATGTDFTVAVLDYTTDVPFTKVAPLSLFTQKTTTASRANAAISAICFDQKKRASSQKLVNYSSERLIFGKDEATQNVFEDIVGGDSGCPVFCLINNHPVLLTLWYSTGLGYNLSSYIPEVNAAISGADALAGVSTGYTLTQADLSGFPSY